MQISCATIDIGNTFIKIGLFRNDTLILYKDRLTVTATADLLNTYTCEKIIVCDVAQRLETLLPLLHQSDLVVLFTSKSHIPIENCYETPHTLGMDRLAAVIGAKALFPSLPCVVIDAGSCITYDLVTADNKYLGGSISLGVAMRYKALNHFTAKLPLLPTETNPVAVIGTTTTKAIHSGVIHGFLNEIKGVVEYYQNNYPSLQVLLCGGDAQFIAERLNSTATVKPYLLLEGLNKISQIN